MNHLILHSKNTRVKPGQERVHWGQTPFRFTNDREIGQLSADVRNDGVRLTQLWVILFCVSGQVDWFPGHRWPGMELALMDPFQLKFDPGVVECCIQKNILISRGNAPVSDRDLMIDGPTSTQIYFLKVDFHHVTTLLIHIHWNDYQCV